MKTKQKVLMVCGPTAAGKTGLALRLAGELGGDLVSCDSRQVYREMDVVTGKDIPEGFGYERTDLRTREVVNIGVYTDGEVRIWGYDVVDPDAQFSAISFVELCEVVLPRIVADDRLPIIVGGTGMYLESWLHPQAEQWIPRDQGLRGRLEEFSIVELQGELQRIDMEKWEHMNQSDRGNPRRLVRAIEIGIYLQSQDVPDCPAGAGGYEVMVMGLDAEMEWIDARIERRVEERLGEEMDTEIRDLMQQEWWSGVAQQTLGYRQWNEYLQGNVSQDEAIELWKTAEKQYARRQMTWFRKYLPNETLWVRVDTEGWQDEILQAAMAWNMVE